MRKPERSRTCGQSRSLLLASALVAFAVRASAAAAEPPAAPAPSAPASPGLVTAKGSTHARSLADRFSEYHDVLDFGAIPNDGMDDSAAFTAAVEAAWDSGRTMIRVPPGRFDLFAPLRPFKNNGSIVRGIAIEGAGHRETRLRFHLRPDVDAIALAGAGPSLGNQTGYGGGLRGVTLESATAPERTSFRDGLSLLYWTDFSFDDVHIQYAARNGVRIINSWTIAGSRSSLMQSGAEALFAGTAAPESVFPTTISFDRVYFFASGTDGASVSVAGFNCWACIFEASGKAGNPAQGAGLVVRNGTTTLNGAYFEGNSGWDVVVGRRLRGDPTYFTTFTSDSSYHWSRNKARSYGLFRFEHANGGSIGNAHAALKHEGPGVWIASDSDVHQLRLHLTSNLWQNTGGIVMGDGSSVDRYRGLIERVDGNGDVELAGRFRIAAGLGARLGDGDTIAGYYSTERVLPQTSIPDDQVWTTTVPVSPSVQRAATLVASLNGYSDLTGVFVSAQLVQTGSARVSILNKSGKRLDLFGTKLRIDALQH